MPDPSVRIRRRLKAVRRTFRELKMIVKGLVSTDHPIQVHIIPMRRCNLSCAYCNEYDDFSDPVPIEEMFRRIDKLAELGTTLVTISGGETLLHPQLDDIIRRIRSHGMISGLITNGYLLTPQRIQQLNEAGLDHLQISIDNVQPDEISVKSLKVPAASPIMGRFVRSRSPPHPKTTISLPDRSRLSVSIVFLNASGVWA
jgi:MoaA/NifB/PqqE/SkfB family radical SAM enzyme